MTAVAAPELTVITKEGPTLTDFTNSAKRILNVVNMARSQSEQPSAAETWATVLGLDPKANKQDPHEVNKSLVLLRHELDLLEQKMKASKFSESLYTPYIRKVRVAVTPGNISASWNNYKQNLDGETILSLRFCSEILDDEPAADFEELESILSRLKEFMASLDSSSINGPTYQFVVSQVRIIEEAIRSYPIAGNSAIKKAFSEGFSDLNARAEDLVQEEQTEVTSKVGEFWNALKSAGKEFVEADRMANAFISIINKGQSLAESAISLLPGPSL